MASELMSILYLDDGIILSKMKIILNTMLSTWIQDHSQIGRDFLGEKLV